MSSYGQISQQIDKSDIRFCSAVRFAIWKEIMYGVSDVIYFLQYVHLTFDIWSFSLNGMDDRF